MGIKCGCGSKINNQDTQNNIKKEHWIMKYKSVSGYDIPIVSTNLISSDILGGWKARWSNNKRMDYMINPGLYGVGDPDKDSIVLVTANYKMTFDKLRKELEGINAWILVLDTKGVNVWCAAGKGTFGTEELIERITKINLKDIVSHNTLILPQLGAVGVQAHIVKKATGFKVLYGPVRAKDIKAYISNNFIKTERMKEITFPILDRIVLIPIELAMAWKTYLIFIVIVGVFNVILNKGISLNLLYESIAAIGSILAGTVFVPILLPWIPFRSFAIKGFILGLIWGLSSNFIFGLTGFNAIANILILSPVSAFLSLQFTGASTITSQTGVKIELKISLPIIIVSLFIGIILKILYGFNIIQGVSL